MDFARDTKDYSVRKQIPDKKSVIRTVDMRCFDYGSYSLPCSLFLEIGGLLILIFFRLDISLASSIIINHWRELLVLMHIVILPIFFHLNSKPL